MDGPEIMNLREHVNSAKTACASVILLHIAFNHDERVFASLLQYLYRVSHLLVHLG